MNNTQLLELDPNGLQTLTRDVLHEAALQGATSAEVSASISKGYDISVRSGDVETVEYQRDRDVGITVYVGQRTGSATLSDTRPEAIREAVKAACNIARFTDEDPFAGLADKSLMAFDYPSVEVYFPWRISVEEAIAIALDCEGQALGDKRITKSDGVSFSTDERISAYANSHGFYGMCPSTQHDMSCVLIAEKGDEMQRDYSYTVACSHDDLQNPLQLAKEAVNRTVRRLGARRLSTRQVPVLFAAEEARSLLGHFIAAISGGNIYRKSSFLLDCVGKQIFPKHISLHEQPLLAKGRGTTPFDNDGVATRPNHFITDGVLQTYCLGNYSAKKLGLKTTGNAGGVHNLFINTGGRDLENLLNVMGTGLYVTEVMGQGVNIVTGDYSRGVSGFWVENGEIQYPVQEITVAGNLADMYASLVEVGSDIDVRGNVRTGSILLDKMMVAGE